MDKNGMKDLAITDTEHLDGLQPGGEDQYLFCDKGSCLKCGDDWK